MDYPVITIIGNGFGGVYTARLLAKRGFHVRLIGREERFTFMPLLHEFATGTLQEGDICFPLASFLPTSRLENIVGEVIAIDCAKKTLTIESGQVLNYEILVIATGARPRLEGIEGLEHAIPLKSVADARRIRDRLSKIISEGRKHIAVNVIGGGYTGMELACELDQLLETKLKVSSKIRVFERGGIPFADTDKALSEYLETRLRRSDIDFYTHSTVSRVLAAGVEANETMYESDLTILAAGVQPNTTFLSPDLLDERNNVVVNEHLQLSSDTNIFALGDIITINGQKPPMLAQLAVRQATIVAQNIERQLRGKKLLSYKPKLIGVLISLGTWDAVGRIFGVPISGRMAWYIWRTVYLFKTPGWINRMRIVWRWTEYLILKRKYIPAAR